MQNQNNQSSQKLFILFFAIFCFSFSQASSVDGKVDFIKIHGSNTIMKQVFLAHEAKIKAGTNVPYTLLGNGSSRGLEDIDHGKADIAMISTSLEELQKRLKDIDWAKMSKHYIGSMRVAFVVNKENPVSFLTLAQVKKILAGKISNWAELGGENEEIVVVSEYYGGGVRSTVEKKLLEHDSISAKLIQTDIISQVAPVVSQIPAAFGVMNIDPDMKMDNIKILITDKEIIQSFHLLTVGEPSPAEESIIKTVQALTQEKTGKSDALGTKSDSTTP